MATKLAQNPREGKNKQDRARLQTSEQQNQVSSAANKRWTQIRSDLDSGVQNKNL